MKWNKSTRFALYAAVEMARAGEELVTIPGVAAKYRISAHHLAKILPQFVRAGLAEAVRGKSGGFRLARAPKDISLLDIVEVFEGKLDLRGCLLADRGRPCAASDACRLKSIFDEIEQQA
ncbi:MAG: Rrf2 family transcriptional regulator, partial [Planctomycetes bacterium]|nr:Rrf2 family transcriptional regulator [Planctomycetota bacterium]